jgi:hypothetical protein
MIAAGEPDRQAELNHMKGLATGLLAAGLRPGC